MLPHALCLSCFTFKLIIFHKCDLLRNGQPETIPASIFATLEEIIDRYLAVAHARETREQNGEGAQPGEAEGTESQEVSPEQDASVDPEEPAAPESAESSPSEPTEADSIE